MSASALATPDTGSKGRMGSPAFTVSVADGGWAGHVVIDSLVDGASSGGLRIASDIEISEVRLLSREMTLKFSFIGLPRGGAKGGIRIPGESMAEAKRGILEEFGRRIAALILTGIYSPGMDMNCSEEDLRAVYRGAGIVLGRITDSSYFTALSVENSILACRSLLPEQQRPVTLAIEGFGSVAAWLASRLDPVEFRITALSTLQGGAANPEGFSPAELVAARKLHRDDMIKHLSGARNIERERVLELDADILVPAARCLTIREENAQAIGARFVVPAANAPYEEKAVDRLHDRGVTCLPGFVVNSGGVFGSSLFDSGVSKDRIERICSRLFRDAVSSLLARSRHLARSPVLVAMDIASLRRQVRPGEKRAGRLALVMKKAYRRGLLPQSVYGRYFERVFSVNLRRLKAEVESYGNPPSV